MKYLLSLFYLYVLSSSCLCAEDQSPKRIVKLHHDYLKVGKIDKAAELTAVNAHIVSNKELFYEALQHYSNILKGDANTTSNLIVIKEYIEGDCALLLTKGSSNNLYELSYLIKIKGKWRILFLLSTWDHPLHALSDDNKRNFSIIDHKIQKQYPKYVKHFKERELNNKGGGSLLDR